MRPGAIARMFQSSHASKRSSGRAVRPITGADRTATHVPLCLQKDPENVRRTARKPHGRVTPPGVPRASRLRMHKRKLLIGLATAGLLLAGFRRRDDAGVGRAAHPAGHAPRRRAGHGDGRRAARHADRPDPDPRRQRADRQRPGRHARGSPRPRPRADARAARCQVQVDPNGGQSKAGADGLAVVLRPPAAASRPPRPTPPTQEPQAGQQAQQVTTGKVAQGSSSG